MVRRRFPALSDWQVPAAMIATVARHTSDHGNRGQRRRHRPESRGAFIVNAVLLWGVVAVATWALMPQLVSIWRHATMKSEQIAEIEASAYYPNCDAARAAGVAPIYRGQPGYREGMDGDSDGIACEPYPH